MPNRHRKTKAVDPFCRGNRRTLLLAKQLQFNRAPGNINDQEIPRSLKNMMAASKIAKQGQTQRQTVQKLGSVERRPEESHNQFMKRVGNRAKKKLRAEKLKLQSDEPESTEGIKKEMTQKKKERLAVLQQRIKGKKFERTLEAKEKDFLKDHVQFGEVVSAPPIITAKPRKSGEKSDRPGQRQLLLKSVFNPSQDRPIITKKLRRTDQTTHGDQRKVKKRKNMTNAEKRNFDKSRAAAISAYRKVKGHGRDSVTLPAIISSPI